jgi:hypothetical protein
MSNCFNKFRINYNILTSVLVLILLSMTYFGLLVQNYTLASLTHEFKNEIESEITRIALNMIIGYP